jgi:type IV pilus assembly protein PilN
MIHINLLPVKAHRKKEAGKQQLYLFGVLFMAGILGNYQWNNSRDNVYQERKTKLESTKREIEKLNQIIGEVKNITAEKKDLQEKLAILDKLKAAKTGPVKMLDELAQITPKKLWLTKIEEKSGSMQFDGVAASIDEVSEFMGALKKSAFFTNVELKKTTLKRTERLKLVDFQVNASANYTPGHKGPEGPTGPGGMPPGGMR